MPSRELSWSHISTSPLFENEAIIVSCSTKCACHSRLLKHPHLLVYPEHYVYCLVKTFFIEGKCAFLYSCTLVHGRPGGHQDPKDRKRVKAEEVVFRLQKNCMCGDCYLL